ncbi:class I SAM-dependent methyltransferase [Anaerovorax odorimutans]|uniref:class I SAM-dependent methyltransferase n=1 Tax=Anaerovorax odorimutans TaxID=109327 RepID=UPI000416607E|nr:class I SAM-dependent methyltransferase [Anaerovorax odorimutans]
MHSENLKPIYSYIAQQIVDDYKITKGKCLDIGTGHGAMGIELAKITDFEMYFIDINPDSIEEVKQNVKNTNLNNKSHYLKADVCNLPLMDNFADFIVSRGSLWFWHDQIKGLQEINRVLKKGGVAFVGGGLGRYTPQDLREKLQGKGRKKLIERGETGFLSGDELQALLDKTGIDNCRLISDVENKPATWIEIRK